MQYRFSYLRSGSKGPLPLPPKAWAEFTEDVRKLFESFEPASPIKAPELTEDRLVFEDKFFTGDLFTLDRVPDQMTDQCSDIDTSDFPYDEVVRGVVLLAGAHFRGRIGIQTDAPKASLDEAARYIRANVKRGFVMPPIERVEAETPISALTRWRQQRKETQEAQGQAVEVARPKVPRP